MQEDVSSSIPERVGCRDYCTEHHKGFGCGSSELSMSKTSKDQTLNWVAVKELKLSYHTGYIYIYI